jgi:hypothetical protein
VSATTLYNEFFAATKARQYRLENKDDSRLFLLIEYETQACGYIDQISIQVGSE